MTPKRELEKIKGFTEAKIDKILKAGNFLSLQSQERGILV
jgi:hypothetical protein